MQIRYQTLRSICALQNRVLHCPGSNLFKHSQKAAKLKREFSVRFDKQTFLNSLSNSSIKAFMDTEKFNVVEPFLHKKNDLKSSYNFVIDEVVAKDIAEKILSNCNTQGSIIAEGNPGLGLITFHLLKSDISHVLVFDNTDMYNFSLFHLLDQCPNKITKECFDMNVQPEKVILRTIDFSKRKGLPWIFIGTATNFYFLRSLVLTSITYTLWQFGIDVYLLLSPRVLNTLLNCGPQLKYFISCGFSVLYTIDEIARYPRSAFLPGSECDEEEMTLIRIKSNQNLHNIIKKEEMVEYFSFTRILGQNKHAFIISTLEKWLPDCGPYLIAKGISITNKVMDLSPRESVVLFNFFKECEGYEEFKALSSNVFMK